MVVMGLASKAIVNANVIFFICQTLLSGQKEKKKNWCFQLVIGWLASEDPPQGLTVMG
jgi:hypothetical protein